MNIFSTLFRYSVYAPENYLTEAFVYLMKELLVREPDVAIALINGLCGFSSKPGFVNASSISCNTQVTLDEGRPDIEIRDDDRLLVYVEVKHNSPLHDGQLEAYKSELLKSGYEETRLILLTRSKQSALDTTLSPDEFHHACWYQIHAFLLSSKVNDKVAEYLIDQFLGFLEEKGMSVKKVSWEYMQGVPSMLNLISMVEAAIEEAIPWVKIKRTGGWNWRGFYVGEMFCGIRYDEPLLVVVENNGGWKPTFRKDLDLEKKLFFALGQDEQLEMIINFIREGYQEMPKKAETLSATSPEDEDAEDLQ